jgi:hypothetical protein
VAEHIYTVEFPRYRQIGTAIQNLVKTKKWPKLRQYPLNSTLIANFQKWLDGAASMTSIEGFHQALQNRLNSELYGLDPETGDLNLSINGFILNQDGAPEARLCGLIVLCQPAVSEKEGPVVLVMSMEDSRGFIFAQNELAAAEKLRVFLGNVADQHKISN